MVGSGRALWIRARGTAKISGSAGARGHNRVVIRAVALLSILVGLLSGCLAAREPDAVLRAEIRNATRRLEERFRGGDLLGVADAYADDALLMGPGGLRVAGREAIDAYWSRIQEPVDWRIDIHEIGGGGDLAYELGTSHLTTVRDGELHTSVVDFVVLWKRAKTASWRIAVDAYWAPVAP